MPRQTRALVFRDVAVPAQIEEVTLSDLQENELLVEMVAVGICHTDMKARANQFPPFLQGVFGHEGGGIIKETGKSVSDFVIGDSVILSFASCAACPSCSSGFPAYCDKLTQMNFLGKREDGSSIVTDAKGHLNAGFFGQSSFSRLAIVKSSSAVKVNANRETLKTIACLGCAFQTGSGAVLNVCQPKVNESLAIFGCGGVGIAAIMAAKLTTPKYLIAIDLQASKLAAAIKYGATHTIDASKEDVETRVKEITEGKGVNYALDAVGSAAILATGHKILATRGSLITIGGTGPNVGPTLPVTSHLQKGLTYRGTHQGDAAPRVYLPKLIDLWERGLFPFDEILTFYPFEDFQKAFDELRDGKVIKPVLVF